MFQWSLQTTITEGVIDLASSTRINLHLRKLQRHEVELRLLTWQTSTRDFSFVLIWLLWMGFRSRKLLMRRNPTIPTCVLSFNLHQVLQVFSTPGTSTVLCKCGNLANTRRRTSTSFIVRQIAKAFLPLVAIINCKSFLNFKDSDETFRSSSSFSFPPTPVVCAEEFITLGCPVERKLFPSWKPQKAEPSRHSTNIIFEIYNKIINC